MNMRLQSKSWMLLLAILLVAGCDSNEEDLSDAELFVGTWTVVRAQDAQGDKTALLNQVGTISVELEADGNFALTFDPVQGDATVLSNTYTVDEGEDEIILNAVNPLGEGTIPLHLAYEFDGEDEVMLTIEETTVDIIKVVLPAFAAFSGQTTLTVQRVD